MKNYIKIFAIIGLFINPFVSSAQTVPLITSAVEVPAHKVTVQGNKQVLGGFATTFYDEPVSVDGMTFTVKTLDGSLNSELTNIVIVDETGQVLAGPDDTTTNGSEQTVVFNNVITFPVGRHVYIIKGWISSPVTDGTTFRLRTNTSSWLNPKGVASSTSIKLPVTQVNMSPVTVVKSKISGKIVSETKNYFLVKAGSSDVKMDTLKIRATDGDVRLFKVGLKFSSGTIGKAHTIKLYKGKGSEEVLVGKSTFISEKEANIVFTSPLLIPKDETVYLTVKVDLVGINILNEVVAGDLIKIDLVRLEGADALSGVAVNNNSVVEGVVGVRMFRSIPTIKNDSPKNNPLAQGKLMRLKISGDPLRDTGIARLNLSFETSNFENTGGVTQPRIFVYSDSRYSQLVNIYDLKDGYIFLGSDQSSLNIPAGSTYYVEVDAKIKGAFASSTIKTTLLGDASYTGVSTASGVSGNFVWSGYSTTSPALISTLDWSNGYGISNLPSTGLSHTVLSPVNNERLAPIITSLSTSTVKIGEKIVVYGHNFNSTQQMSLNGLSDDGYGFDTGFPEESVSLDGKTITFIIPSSSDYKIRPGLFNISIFDFGNGESNSVKLRVNN